MPNQSNFRSDVTTPTDPRYTASRIVRVPTDLILLEEVPASFAFDKDDVVEIHFYTIPENQRVISTIANISDQILKSHIVSYVDNTNKNYIRVDLTKLFKDKNLVLIPGDYRMVLNFFSNEIGTYDDRILTLNTISPSRTEVELTFNNTTDEVYRQENLNLLREFVEPSFNKSDAVGVAEKIFKSGIELGLADVVEEEGVTASTIVKNIEIPEENQTFDNTIGRVDKIGLGEIFDQQLNDFLVELYGFVREEIVINGDERIQEDQYQEIIRNVVKEKIANLRQVMDSRIKIS